MTADAIADVRGFSFVELLVATAITITVTALACALAVDAYSSWRVESARVDLHQRARVVADMLTRALSEAGAGPHGGVARGPLARFVPPIVPRRIGRRGADPPTRVRTDVFTTLRVMGETEHGALMVPATAGTTALDISPTLSPCALPACGFGEGDNVLVLDPNGSVDGFSVLGAVGQILTVRHHGSGSEREYPIGSPVLGFESATYYLDRDARLLRRYDGDASDVPVVDDVVDLLVEYYGDRQPPRQPRPPIGTANCLYESDGTYRSALLPVLSSTGADQAPLRAEQLTDGPWCGTGANQFDADLLRTRRVRVTVRLQAGDPAVRGTDTARFREPGVATRSVELVPDVSIVLDVSPRNLRAAW
jgi:hypothetical protein